MPAHTRRKLIIYAYCAWLYRFFFFLGLALLVYHLFFKALGLALMAIELIWFIGLPIYKEIKHWHSRRAEVHLNRRTICSGLILLAALLLFVVPWHTRVEGGGILSAAHSATLYARQGAQVENLYVRPGQTVQAGDLILRLTSPDLDKRISVLRRQLDTSRHILAASSLDPALRASYSVDVREMQALTTELDGLELERVRLTFVAPFAGALHDVPAWLKAGVWAPASAPLGILVESGRLVTAYVPEEDADRIQVGDSGHFYPVSGLIPPLPVRILPIEHNAVRDLSHPELPSTVHGGIIPARRLADGRIVPEQALYRVLCQVESDDIPAQALSGHVSFAGARRSFAARLWQAGLGLLIRESGWD